MIPLYLVLILNTVVSHQFVLDHRMSLGGMPINMVEGAILLTLLYVILVPMKTAPIDRTKKNYFWPVLILWVIALLGGGLLGFGAGVRTYDVLQMMKWNIKMPLGVMCGYLAVRNLKNVRRAVKVICVLSCIVCVMILLHFREKSAQYNVTGAEGVLRTMKYNVEASAIVVIFLVYTAAVNPRFFSRASAKVILAMSIVAAAGTLTRSIIVAMVSAMVAIIVLIPKVFRGRAWRVLFTSGVWIVAIVLLAGVLLQLVLGVDMIGATVARFKGEEGAEGTVTTRWEGAMEEMGIWLDSTIIFGSGFGFAKTKIGQAGYGIVGHNGYTTTLAKMGIIGFLALTYPLFVAIRMGRRMTQQFDSGVRALGALVMAGAIYSFFLSFLSGGLAGERSALFFGLLLGMGIKCYRFELPSHELTQEAYEYSPNG